MTANAFALRVNLADLNAQLDTDAEAMEAAARPSAQAAAQVLYNEVKRNVARLKRHTGNLDRSIYQAFSKDNSFLDNAVYPEFDSSKAHFLPTSCNGAGFRAMRRQKPRYTGC